MFDANAETVDNSTENVETNTSENNFLDLDPETLDLFGSSESTIEDTNTDVDNSETISEPIEEDVLNVDNTEDDPSLIKFKGKSREEIIEAYKNLESMSGKYASRKADLENYDMLMERIKGENGFQVAKMLEAIIKNDFSDLSSIITAPQSEEQIDTGLPEDFEYMSESEKSMYKRMQMMEKNLKEITEKLSKSGEAIQHADQRRKQEEFFNEARKVANDVGSRHKMQIDPKDLITFAKENAATLNFNSWQDVAYEYVIAKKGQITAKRREAQSAARGAAPKVTPGASQKPNAPIDVFKDWGDIGNLVRSHLSK